MNGRIYDRRIGRFTSADPMIQAPYNLQSYNRYSYAFNSPLNGVDLSGYGLLSFINDIFDAVGDLGSVAKGVSSIAESKVGRMGLSIGVGYMTGQWYLANFGGWSGASVAAGALGGFSGTMVATGGDFEASVKGAIVGAGFGWAGGLQGNLIYAGHAAVGCASGELQGGGCLRGAASAVAGKLVTAHTPDAWNDYERFAATVVTGGSVSVIGGGQFANGALSAAMGYLYNKCMHAGCNWSNAKISIAGNYAAGPLGKYGTYPSSLHFEIRIENAYDFLTIEGQPGDYSLKHGYRLVSGASDPHPSPVFSMELPTPVGLTTQQLASNLISAAQSYQNNLPYNFPLAGTGTMLWGYNSNSYVSGVLMQATGQYQSGVVNAARNAGFLVPGFNKPIPLGGADD